MIKIAICDDKLDQIKIMRAALDHYEQENSDSNFDVSSFDNSFLFLEELENGAKFDILLLDICMPGVLGTELAKFVRKNKDKAEIIFITTSDDFAVDAFALKATHYLLKPFNQVQFNDAINMAIEHVQAKVDKSITFKCSGGIVASISLAVISYIESFSHEQIIHLTGGEILETRQTLSGFIEQLDSLAKGQFISPCKGFIVNQNQIRTIAPDAITMKGGETVPIIKRMYRKTKDTYFEYMFGGK